MGGHSDFAVVSSRSRTPALQQFFDSSAEQIDLESGVVVCRWEIDDAQVLYPHRQPTRSGPRVVVCGTPVSGRPGTSAESLAERGGFDDLIGPFAILRILPDGSFDVTADSFGLQGLYWLDEPGVQVVATRLDLAVSAFEATTGRRVTANVGAALAVAARGLAFDEDTAVEQVRLVEFGSRVESAADGALVQRPWWPTPWDVAPRSSGDLDDLVDAELERQINGLKEVVERSEGPVEVDLTGGKDSRLVLALCASAGVVDRVVFVTRGGINQPDVVAATHVAAELGLTHTRSPWEGARDSWDRELLERARLVAGRAGLFSDPQVRIGRSWRVPGFLGETWRTNYPKQNPDDSLDRIIDREHEFLRRRSGYLSAAAFDQVADRAATQLSDIAGSARTSDVRDAQYILDRARTWLGSRVRSFDRTYLALYSPGMTSLGFALGVEARIDETLRLAATRRSPLEALDLPFTKLLGRGVGLSELPPTPDQERQAQGDLVLWPPPIRSYQDYQQLRQQTLERAGGERVERWSAIRSLLLDDGPDHGVFDFVDYDAVRADLDAAPKVTRHQDMWLCDILGAKLQLGM